MSPVLYMSLERFRSAPINHFILCIVYKSRTSVNEQRIGKNEKVNIRGYPGISPGHFIHCQYRNQSVSTPRTREKQSVSVTVLGCLIFSSQITLMLDTEVTLDTPI